jgi:phospholipid-transporting ATPase
MQADSIVKARLSPHQKLSLDNELTQFSNIGLRTLLVAMRIISEKEYGNFVTAVERIPQARR